MYQLASHERVEVALVDKWLDLLGQGCVVVENGIVVMMNEAAGNLLGLDAKQYIGAAAVSLVQHLETPHGLESLLLQVGSGASIHCSRQAAEGKRVHLWVQAKRVSAILQESQAAYLLLSISDVSQVVQAEVDAAEQHRRWQALGAGVVVVSVNEPDLPIVYVNAAFEQMTGYSAQECIGRNCRFLQGNLHDQPGIQAIRQALMEKRNGYAVLRNFRKDGSEFLNELFVSPMFDALTGSLTHFIGVQHLRTQAVLPHMI